MGTDVDGDEIYAGRAPHEGDILPAKVIPNKNACYVSWGGEEIVKDQFEVTIWVFKTEKFLQVIKTMVFCVFMLLDK